MMHVSGLCAIFLTLLASNTFPALFTSYKFSRAYLFSRPWQLPKCFATSCDVFDHAIIFETPNIAKLQRNCKGYKGIFKFKSNRNIPVFFFFFDRSKTSKWCENSGTAPIYCLDDHRPTLYNHKPSLEHMFSAGSRKPWILFLSFFFFSGLSHHT